MDIQKIQNSILKAWEDPTYSSNTEFQNHLQQFLKLIEAGKLRVMAPQDPTSGQVPMENLKDWQVFDWVKKGILLVFRTRKNQNQDGVSWDKLSMIGPPEGSRKLPGSYVREGSFIAEDCVLMPSFVNVGAYVSKGTMVDTWATVGSCAQIGSYVHLAGGVGIGGVLEPPSARPVCIGDSAFIGSRAVIVEGAIVSENAIIAANVCITATTPIYDVSKSVTEEFRGYVPPGAVVVPGTREKIFPGGKAFLNCAYIIHYRNPKSQDKVALNTFLREQGIPL